MFHFSFNSPHSSMHDDFFCSMVISYVLLITTVEFLWSKVFKCFIEIAKVLANFKDIFAFELSTFSKTLE